MDDHEQQKCLSSGMLSECHSHQREENLLNERGNLTSDHNGIHILSITLFYFHYEYGNPQGY